MITLQGMDLGLQGKHFLRFTRLWDLYTFQGDRGSISNDKFSEGKVLMKAKLETYSHEETYLIFRQDTGHTKIKVCVIP